MPNLLSVSIICAVVAEALEFCMNIYIVSEQVGLEGYWITDILDGISKESLKKNITVVDYDGRGLDTSEEAPRPIVLAVGYSAHWMETTCEELKSQNVSPILVNADHNVFTEILSSIGYVSFGVKRAVYEVMSYLLGVKRSKIAFFGAHAETYADDVKAEEYLRLANFWGLPVAAGDIYRSDYIAECFKRLEPRISEYNAILCTSDAAAAYVIKKCGELSIRVPADIAVTGFGNSRLCEHLMPSITTVENNYVELGRQAVKLHQLLQKNSDINAASISVNCPLILRDSTPGNTVSRSLNVKKPSVREPQYVTDPDLMSALQAEELLKNWDDIDKSIASGLLLGKTVVSIADGLFVSISAVKYRIKKMLIQADLKNKAELVKLIKKYNLI